MTVNGFTKAAGEECAPILKPDTESKTKIYTFVESKLNDVRSWMKKKKQRFKQSP